MEANIAHWIRLIIRCDFESDVTWFQKCWANPTCFIKPGWSGQNMRPGQLNSWTTFEVDVLGKLGYWHFLSSPQKLFTRTLFFHRFLVMFGFSYQSDRTHRNGGARWIHWYGWTQLLLSNTDIWPWTSFSTVSWSAFEKDECSRNEARLAFSGTLLRLAVNEKYSSVSLVKRSVLFVKLDRRAHLKNILPSLRGHGQIQPFCVGVRLPKKQQKP